MSMTGDLAKIDGLYRAIEGYLEMPEDVLRSTTDVSRWSVAQQIAHVAGANRFALANVVAMVEGRKTFEESGRMTLIGRVVLTTGYIPRGVGKAPAAVSPEPDVSLRRLNDQWATQRDYLRRIEADRSRVERLRQRFEHPFFGFLRPAEWVRFVHVHTRHHDKIIRDIIGSQG